MKDNHTHTHTRARERQREREPYLHDRSRQCCAAAAMHPVSAHGRECIGDVASQIYHILLRNETTTTTTTTTTTQGPGIANMLQHTRIHSRHAEHHGRLSEHCRVRVLTSQSIKYNFGDNKGRRLECERESVCLCVCMCVCVYVCA